MRLIAGITLAALVGCGGLMPRYGRYVSGRLVDATVVQKISLEDEWDSKKYLLKLKFRNDRDNRYLGSLEMPASKERFNEHKVGGKVKIYVTYRGRYYYYKWPKTEDPR